MTIRKKGWRGTASDDDDEIIHHESLFYHEHHHVHDRNVIVLLT